MKPFDGKIQPTKISFDSEAFCVQFHDLPMDCMTLEIGEQIVRSLRGIVEVDVGCCWIHFLRVRLELNLMKPLVRGWFIKFNSQKM